MGLGHADRELAEASLLECRSLLLRGGQELDAVGAVHLRRDEPDLLLDRRVEGVGEVEARRLLGGVDGLISGAAWGRLEVPPGAHAQHSGTSRLHAARLPVML